MLGFSPISAAPISGAGNFVISISAAAPGADLTGNGTIAVGGASGGRVGDATAPGISITSISSIQAGSAYTGSFTGSISDADIARIVQAVLAALNATTIPVDMRSIKGKPIAGEGLTGDEFHV